MQFELTSVTFTRDPAGWNQLTIAPGGEVGQDLRRRGNRLQALARATVQKKTGNLARSINVTYFPVKNPYVMVGSENRNALRMHNGTRPHWISPDNQEVLRFVIRGRVVYSRRVHHPGTRGSFYLTRHLRKIL